MKNQAQICQRDVNFKKDRKLMLDQAIRISEEKAILLQSASKRMMIIIVKKKKRLGPMMMKKRML